jgi:NADH-quinone oxidoreductase subunit C
MSAKLFDVLRERFGDAVLETSTQHRDEMAVVDPERWVEIARVLRDDPRCDMKMMIDLCAVDYPERTPRFEVVLHLYSIALGHRLRLKARVDEEIASVTTVWPGANWFERETYDLMGIRFVGHPDLRRILLYPEFVGHPLRKDYPAAKTQPLVPLREDYDKLAPFDASEGMPFGRRG